MPFAAAVAVVAVGLLGVAAVVLGARTALPRRSPRARRLAGLAVAVVGAAVLLLAELLPRAWAADLPADDPCLPDAVQIDLDALPLALQAATGAIRGQAVVDAEGMTDLVVEELDGTPLASGDPRATLGNGEVVLEVGLPLGVVDVPLSATIEPTVADGALVLRPAGFTVVGVDVPEWAVALVDAQLQDADSVLSQALAPAPDGPCADADDTGTVRLVDVAVDDEVRVDFEVPVSRP